MWTACKPTVPVYTLFSRSLSVAVDREGLGTLGPRLNDFNRLAVIGRSLLRVTFGQRALTHGEIAPHRRGSMEKTPDADLLRDMIAFAADRFFDLRRVSASPLSH